MLHFIDIATGSAKELGYQLSVVDRLKMSGQSLEQTTALCDETIRILSALGATMRQQLRQRAALEL